MPKVERSCIVDRDSDVVVARIRSEKNLTFGSGEGIGKGKAYCEKRIIHFFRVR